MSNPFATGVIIFFRILDDTSNLARSVHLDGRSIVIQGRESHPEDYMVLNEAQEVIGIYPRDWVACILPAQTVGPAGDPSQPS